MFFMHHSPCVRLYECACVTFVFVFRLKKHENSFLCLFRSFRVSFFSFFAFCCAALVVRCSMYSIEPIQSKCIYLLRKSKQKSEIKFFEFKVRMLHMYAAAAAACASSSMGILLIVCCCSVRKLFSVPFHFLLFSFKEVHEKELK